MARRRNLSGVRELEDAAARELARQRSYEVLGPYEEVALPSFQRVPGQPGAPAGPAQDEPTAERLQSQRILQVNRSAPIQQEERSI
eukprot:6757623-Alexandrium_andersonii.AAC.1